MKASIHCGNSCSILCRSGVESLLNHKRNDSVHCPLTTDHCACHELLCSIRSAPKASSCWKRPAAKGIEYEVRTGLKGDALRETLAEFDGAICRSGVKITADVLAGNHKLKAIVRAGVGTDNIDKDSATRLGIVVMNTPAGNTLSTAEHTLAMMLALSRNVAPAYQSLIEHNGTASKYMGTQLADKTLGIVGLGRIGQAVAKRAKAFEMRVLGYDPFLSRRSGPRGAWHRAGRQRSRTCFRKVDYLTVHTPLTEETTGIVNQAEP